MIYKPNYYYLIGTAVLVFLSLVLVFPGDEIYTHENSTLILKQNGNYYVEQERSFGGTYHRTNNRVMLNIPFGVFILVECPGGLCDEEGDVWLRV